MAEKRIGYTSPYLPPEIIWAGGLVPVRLRPGTAGAGLAASDGYLHRNFSVEARALLAAARDGSLDVAAAVFLDEDDTVRRFCDVWRAYAGIPALGLVALPRRDDDAACRRYAAALARLAETLCTVGGRPPDDDHLEHAIALYNEQRRLWRALRAFWVAGALSAEQWHELRWDALTTDPLEANAGLAASLAGCEAAPGPEPAGPRLLALGAMVVTLPFLRFVEACGSKVVAEDSDADERTLVEPVPVGDRGIYERLAAAYLAKPPGPRPAALARRLDRLARLIDERHVQGAIALYPKFADAYLAEYLALAELFQAHGIPALLLEDDGESGFSGQQRTRVEAFLEVIS